MAKSQTPLLGVLAVLLAAGLWGTTGTIQGLLPPARDPIAVAVFRLIIGAAALVFFSLFSARLRAGFFVLPLKQIAMASLAIGLYNLFFFSAVSMAGVGVGTAIAIGSGPVWVSLYEIVFHNRKPPPLQLLGQAICIAGAVALVASNDLNDGNTMGYLLAALAGLAYATFSIITNQLSQGVPSASIAAATFTLAAVFTAPFLLVADTAWVGIGTLPPLLFLGLIVTGVAYYLFTFGVRAMSSSAAVTLALAEPLTAWLLATFVLGEELTALKIFGALILLAGLWIVSKSLPGRTLQNK